MPEVDRTAERDREDPMKSFVEVRGGPDNSQASGQSYQCSFGICFEEVSCNRHYGPPVAGVKRGIGIQPSKRKYNRRGGRPGLNVDFVAVCDAVRKARNGGGETMTDVAERFGLSRGWIHKWVYPELAISSLMELGSLR